LLAIILAACLLVSGLATIIVLADFAPVNSNLSTVIFLLNVDLILALLLGAIVARPVVRKWITKKYGPSGSRLHMRIVVSFGLVAIIPALLVILFLGLFLNFAMETWFSERVSTAVNTSSVVAKSYLKEHQKNIRGIALSMANELNRSASKLRQNPRLFNNIVSTLSDLRSLSEAVVVDSSGRTLARSQLSFSLGFNFGSDDFLKGVLSSRPGEVLIIKNRNENIVRAGTKLEGFVDAYLLVGKFVDAQVLEHISQTTGAADQYNLLKKNRDNLQIKFLFVFAIVAFFLVMAAIWVGWSIASKISTPIGNLIDASGRVRDGDLSARVDFDIVKDDDEIGKLSHSFNLMTQQLFTQQQKLVGANGELEERRRFTEVVLSGVSAGVIGLDKLGRVNLPNRSASELLSIDLTKYKDKYLGDCVPEMESLVKTIILNPNNNIEGEIKIERDKQAKTLVVSMAAERIEQNIVGFVVTFDDISELLLAQRKAAWSDVAQRIAHEIKNPLTPIQLSAERLKRKYKNEITTDPETFLMCTETIVRQVQDIGRMVDEFSSFSRMPEPELSQVNLTDLCKECMFLEGNRVDQIHYEFKTAKKKIILSCDRQQISRLLNNILKNAAESISDWTTKDVSLKGRIELKLTEQNNVINITILDNGVGFPKDLIETITEPYVTTRKGGTGLGLSIAAKIMEDHSGNIILRNRSEGGAEVILNFEN
jgi:two-component system nitrogen regulation sensor histidine kinase NtrY